MTLSLSETKTNLRTLRYTRVTALTQRPINDKNQCFILL